MFFGDDSPPGACSRENRENNTDNNRNGWPINAVCACVPGGRMRGGVVAALLPPLADGRLFIRG